MQLVLKSRLDFIQHRIDVVGLEINYVKILGGCNTNMKCSLCNKEVSFYVDNKKNICESCKNRLALMEASYFSYLEWEIMKKAGKILEEEIDSLIKGKLLPLCKSDNEQEKATLLIGMLQDQLAKHILFYSEYEVKAAIMTLKEITQRALLNKNYPDKWKYIMDMNAYKELVMVFKTHISNKYGDKQIGEEENFISHWKLAITIARRIVLIKTNLKMIGDNSFWLDKTVTEAIPTNDEIDCFFEEYLESGISDKPEDYNIENEALNKSLQDRKLTPKHILCFLDGEIKQQLGFTISDLKTICMLFIETEFKDRESFITSFENESLFDNSPLLIGDYDDIKKAILDRTTISSDAIDKIFSYFSIDSDNIIKEESIDITTNCFITKYLCVGVINFVQAVSIIEKCLMANHYLDILRIKITSKIAQAQNKLATFFSACITDVLVCNGYIVPMQNENGVRTPRFEIDKIKIDKENILKECGDIDVLAFNSEKNEIIIIEAKFYEPLIDEKNMDERDKKRIINGEVIRKMKAREDVVKNNKEVFLNLLGVVPSEKECKVRSYLITSRANYYGLNSMKDTYLTWIKFIEMAQSHVF